MKLLKDLRSLYVEEAHAVVVDLEEFSRDIACAAQALSEAGSAPCFRRNGLAALSHLRRARNAVDAVNAAVRRNQRIQVSAASLEIRRICGPTFLARAREADSIGRQFSP
jgi:hypothetical protein